ncbi:MAG: hypothetical protein Q4D62_13690 [Planctomycetia bacterium]|nr:hypothetical protein [Planctomycetia bacterium]
MSLKLDSRVTADIGWSWSERKATTSVIENGNVRQQQVFTSDVSPEVDAVWSLQEAPLAGSAEVTYDLQNLTREVLDVETTIALEKLCAIYVCNQSSSGEIYVEMMETACGCSSGVTGSDPFLRATLPSKGFFCWCNPNADSEVTTDQKQLVVGNATDQAATYDLVVTGKKVVSEGV